jgi:3-oxoadipyl-CoA thiolase
MIGQTQSVYLCDAVRTPIGRYGGVMAQVRSDDMAAHVIKSLLTKFPTLPSQAIDEVVLGCANQAGEDNRNVARMALLLAGLPVTVAGLTVNRLCASGLDAIATAARTIALGEANIIIAGGVESMTRAPMVMPKASSAFAREMPIFDSTIGWRFVNPWMETHYGIDSMPETAEYLAEQFAISRSDQDAYAYRSQQRTENARACGFLSEEIVSITSTIGKQQLSIDKDEHPRAEATLDSLAQLKPFVRKDGSITAGNASGVNDGAAVMLLAGESAIKQYGLVPKAKILGMRCVGVEPKMMGMGPVPAIHSLLHHLNMQLEQFSVIEINEAFASQVLACTRALGLPDDTEQVNPNGGAIALGHPLGMSGARITMSAVNQLQRSGDRYALISMCVGVGQGMALAIERV